MEAAEKGGSGKAASRNLAPGIRLLLAALGIALLVGAGLLWLSPPPATIQTTTHSTVERTTVPPSKGHGSVASRTSVHTTKTTDQVLTGRRSQLNGAQPAGGASTRSETIAIALLTAGTLFVILGVMPTLPNKLGFGTATAEWSPEEIVQASATTSAAAISAGVQDPKVVGNLARAVVHRASSEKARAPDARVDWERVASAALKDVVPDATRSAAD